MSFQIASIGSLVVVLGTFLRYKKEIQKNSSQNSYDNELLQKVEDPYFVFEEEEEEIDPKEFLLHQKQKIKRFSFGSFLLGAKLFFTPFRFVGYLILIVGFLWLKSNSFLDLFGYLMGVSLLLISAFIQAYQMRNY